MSLSHSSFIAIPYRVLLKTILAQLLGNGETRCDGRPQRRSCWSGRESRSRKSRIVSASGPLAPSISLHGEFSATLQHHIDRQDPLKADRTINWPFVLLLAVDCSVVLPYFHH